MYRFWPHSHCWPQKWRERPFCSLTHSLPSPASKILESRKYCWFEGWPSMPQFVVAEWQSLECWVLAFFDQPVLCGISADLKLENCFNLTVSLSWYFSPFSSWISVQLFPYSAMAMTVLTGRPYLTLLPRGGPEWPPGSAGKNESGGLKNPPKIWPLFPQVGSGRWDLGSAIWGEISEDLGSMLFL